MQLKPSDDSARAVEARVSSKGQVTLPKSVRSQLGIRTGSRIRFTLPADGGFRAHRVLYDLEDLWKMTDEGGKAAGVMSFEEMNEAKARRAW